MESIHSSSSALSLLIVDDDISAIETLRLMIPMKFPDVIIYVAGNGKMGVELCKEHAPDIVVTDINMPEMDGIQMAEEIKSMKVDTKFIAISGYSDKIHLDKFNDIGISDYMLKPIDLKKLFAAIGKCIDEINL